MPKSSTQNSQIVKTEANEPIVQQMQKQADQFTRKYQWERRNAATLEGAHEKLLAQIETVKLNLAKLEKDIKEGDTKKNRTKIKNLVNETDIVDKKINETSSEIEKLKQTIDLMRQEKTLFENSLNNMTIEIEKAQQDMDRLGQEIEFGQNSSKTSQNLIMDLKLKNEADKTHYFKKMSNLNRNLRENKSVASRSVYRTDKIDTVQLDTVAVLKKRLAKLIQANKEKVKLIESYQKNMRVINEAFQSIKEATGISDIDEIQNVFIKGEEQSYGLLTYVDVLNQQLDNLADSNAQLSAKISQLESENQEREASRNSLSTEEQQVLRLKEQIQKKKKRLQVYSQQLQDIQPTFKDTLVKLAKSKFNTKWPNKHHEYLLGGVQLSESTIDNFMSELEEFSNQLLFFKGKLGNQPNCEVFAKTLLLEELEAKDFKKKIIENTIALNNSSGVGSSTNVAADDIELTRELLTPGRLKQIALKDIDKQKNGVDKPKSKKN